MSVLDVRLASLRSTLAVAHGRHDVMDEVMTIECPKSGMPSASLVAIRRENEEQLKPHSVEIEFNFSGLEKGHAVIFIPINEWYRMVRDINREVERYRTTGEHS